MGFNGVIAAVAEQKMQLGIENKIDFVFDEQGKLGDIAQSWFKEMHKDERFKNVLKPYLCETPTFKDDKIFLPLQAADMLAWHVRRYYDSTLPENKSGPNCRSILKKFGTLPALHRELTAEHMKLIVEGATLIQEGLEDG